ncbi:transporter substrate-binding domain-containing protein [Microbulbifer elongatus]|uniref:transporter substrate-binding domain-containing protein n=1 Tax=Microbulbifer elongatus TaxID=86173 RepID=UPI001CFD6600|nr:transporter substrate-binding domain-containing protein [Microbulbifer elongatus]
MGKPGKVSVLFILLAQFLTAGCGQERGRQPEATQQETLTDAGVNNFDVTPIAQFENYVETGDLDAIRKRGKLRLLVDPSRASALHRAATQQDVEISHAERMAKALGLTLVVLEVDAFPDLIPTLNAGKGDLIANNLVVTDARKQKVDFTSPTAETRIVLVSAVDTPDTGGARNLKGKTLVVTEGTAFEQQARTLGESNPGLNIELTRDNYVDLLVKVADGNIDFTIVDQEVLDLVKQFRDDIKANHIFEGEFALAWALRKNSPKLREALEKQVQLIRLTRPEQRSIGDLDAIKERGVLRAVTRNHPGTFFMWKGQLLGFEFSLLEKFAASLDVRLAITVAETHEDFVRLLENGDADVSASLLAITDERKASGMAFSSPYLESSTGIVGRKGEKINDEQDLSGRTVCVRPASSQYQVAQKLQQNIPRLKIQEVDSSLDIQSVIDLVVEQQCDLAIADEVSVKLEQTWRDDVTFAFDLPDKSSRYAWMVRDGNPKLLEAINQFFDKNETDKALPQLLARYFKTPKRTRPEIEELAEAGEISPFDEYVRRYAQEHGFDWRLLVAQMYQESNFDPKARSWVGARGLMQVMPDTGKQVGETDLEDPETSVRAGVKYMRWLYAKFEDKGITPDNRMWFTLASYNAGLGHVYDAQNLAEKKGWDRNVWFENVERAMLLLSDPNYYKKAQYGYARGQEPVDYVRKIEARFRSFVSLLEAQDPKKDSGS